MKVSGRPLVLIKHSASAQVTNKRGAPEEYRALRLDGRAGVVYWGDAKHEQTSSLSHERDAPLPPEGPKEKKRKEKKRKDLTPMTTTMTFDKSNARGE